MKKILCAVVAVLLIFTGCSMKGKRIEPLLQNLSSQVKIRHKSIDYEAQLVHDESQTKIIYSLPKSHGGLTLVKNKDSCSAELFGLNVTPENEIFTENSAIVLIDSVLNILLSGSDECEQKIQDDTVILSGKIGDDRFEAVRYKNKPKLISISVPTQELTVTFEEKIIK